MQIKCPKIPALNKELIGIFNMPQIVLVVRFLQNFWKKLKNMKTLNKIAIIWSICFLFLLSSLYIISQRRHVSVSPVNTPTPTAFITPTPTNYYSVVKVVDGDTINVSLDNKTEKVRLLGINTPEVVDPRVPVQCFGKEASDFAKSILAGKKVRLEPDPTQGDVDSYGRLLRYVYLEDDTFVNKLMIEKGYAFEYTYKLPYKYRDEFRAAQKTASEQNLGLWSPSTCNGQLKPKNK